MDEKKNFNAETQRRGDRDEKDEELVLEFANK
jgi:hypothetical protein